MCNPRSTRDKTELVTKPFIGINHCFFLLKSSNYVASKVCHIIHDVIYYGRLCKEKGSPCSVNIFEQITWDFLKVAFRDASKLSKSKHWMITSQKCHTIKALKKALRTGSAMQ